MKHRIIALVALIVSLVALGFSIGMLNYSIENEFINNSGYIIQIIGVMLIVIICAVNYILALQKDDNISEDND